MGGGRRRTTNAIHCVDGMLHDLGSAFCGILYRPPWKGCADALASRRDVSLVLPDSLPRSLISMAEVQGDELVRRRACSIACRQHRATSFSLLVNSGAFNSGAHGMGLCTQLFMFVSVWCVCNHNPVGCTEALCRLQQQQ